MDDGEGDELAAGDVPVPLLLQHPLGGEELAGEEGAEDGEQADPGPGGVAGGEEGVGGDDVEDNIAEVRG